MWVLYKMPGGLLNLVAYGNQNVILTGNPSKTFFKCAYAKYTNFGLQKFRLDFDGQRTLRLDAPSTFKFKVPRYADLLMDTYLVVTLPTVWSPIYPPDCNNGWRPYEFKWIKNLGTQMIQRVRFTVGGQLIQEFTGQYLYNLVERDFNDSKKDLYYKMTGNVTELNDPANADGRTNVYPSAYYYDPALCPGPEPSIRGRKLYIPLNIWFTLAAKMAFPLVSLQYNELHIEVEMRPVRDLFVIRNIPGIVGNDPGDFYHRADFNKAEQQFNMFLQPPLKADFTSGSDEAAFPDTRTNWAADIHLISTYAFLTDDEVRVFAAQPQSYLIKEAYQYKFPNLTGPKRVQLETLGMVSDWMWFFQRSDVALRNEWSNYTNWPYDYLPYNLVDPSGTTKVTVGPCPPGAAGIHVDPSQDPSGTLTSIRITPWYSPMNQKDIMTSWALLLDGKYRENQLDAGVLNYVEKYTRTSGNGPDGQYCYNFCLHTNPFDFQPSGAINLSKFQNIEFELGMINPPLDASAQVATVCNDSGDIIGINKPVWRIYEYSYDMTVLEERYNVLNFTSGNAALMYAR